MYDEAGYDLSPESLILVVVWYRRCRTKNYLASGLSEPEFYVT